MTATTSTAYVPQARGQLHQLRRELVAQAALALQSAGPLRDALHELVAGNLSDQLMELLVQPQECPHQPTSPGKLGLHDRIDGALVMKDVQELHKVIVSP